MRALQLHYTSCRRGHSGSSGFQTRTLTPGIRPEEQREIERRGVYRPPRDATPEPDAEELACDFPVALRYYALESGRRALTRSGYVGRDYSGRWGNFFAHTLVFENGWEASAWPIDYFEWPHWQRGLTAEEDTEEEAPELAEIEVDRVDSESFRLEDLGEFLREEPGRAALLTRMGRAIFLGRESSRVLVVRDSPLNNLYWIACLQKLFPPRHAAGLSSSSYQEDPRDCADVNATCGETGFSFGDAERNYQFYMFDLVGGVASEVPNDADDYPALAARWLAEDPAELRSFFEFTDLFDHQRLEPQLVSAFHLFELSRNRDPALEGERLAAMIRFAARHATPAGRQPLLEVVAGAVDRLGGLRRPADYEDVVRFLTEGARTTGRPQDRVRAHETWLRLVDDQLCGPGRGEDLDTALAVADRGWKCLRSVLPDAGPDLAKRFLTRRQAWELQALPSATLAFLLRRSWECLTLLQRTPAWEQLEVEELVAALLSRPGELISRSQAALEAVPAEATALAEVARLAGRTPGDHDPRAGRVAAGQALGRVLARMPARHAGEVRRRLGAEGDFEGWDLLHGEWLEICQEAGDPVSAFREYRRTVLAFLPGYAREGLSWTASSLLRRVDEERASTLAVEWLHAGDLGSFSDELTGRCLDLANRALPLDPKGAAGEALARRLVAEAATHERELRPDRPLLRRALAEAPKARHLDAFDLPAIQAAVDGLDAADYNRFLKDFLPPAFTLPGNREEHARLIAATFQVDHFRTYRKHYLRSLRERPRKAWFVPFLAALKFWLALDRRMSQGRDLAPLEEPATREMAFVLSRLSARDLKKVEHNLRSLNDSATRRWRRLLEDVEKSKKGPLGKLRRLLPRIPGLGR